MSEGRDPVTDTIDPGDIGACHYAASEVIADTGAEIDTRINHLLTLGCACLGFEMGQYLHCGERNCVIRYATDETRVGTSFSQEEIPHLQLDDGPHIVEVADIDPQFLTESTTTLVGVPVALDREQTGSLWFFDTTNRSSLSTPERQLLSHLAHGVETLLQHDKQRQTLQAVHETVQQLLAAKTPETVAERAVEAFVDVLGLPITGVWLYDEETDTLVPTAWSEESEQFIGEPPTFDGTDSISWRAFKDGEIRWFDDVRNADQRYNDETIVRSELVIPLGHHGVINIGDATPRQFDATTRTHAQLLAENTLVALEQAEKEASLQAARDRFQAFFESANDAILVVTEDEIIDCNERATEILGYDRDELIGAPPEQFHPGQASAIRDIAREALETGHAHDDGVTYVRKDGQTVPAEIRISAVELDGEAYLLVNLRDNRESERRERLTGVLNRVLRHNLQNEVNVIGGYADIISEEATTDNIEQAAATIRRRADALESLSKTARQVHERVINGLAGDRYRPTDLLEAVATAMSRQHGVTIKTDASACGTERIDSGLYPALEELSDNAISHADSPNPRVELTAEPTDTGVRFTVTDNGPGIAKMEQEVFHTGEESPVSHGQGLGLWLVRWIVGDLDGTVEIESTGPEGTTIVVEVPTA